MAFDDILGDIFDVDLHESGEIPEWCPNCWCSDVVKTHIMRPKDKGPKGMMERQWVCLRCSYDIWC